MIAFILGIAAGYAAPHAEVPLKRALAAVMLAETSISEAEARLASFAVCLLGAAVLGSVFGSGSGVALALGALLGVFAPRLIERYWSRD